eukprot:4547214-Amphidinium_carterae.1
MESSLMSERAFSDVQKPIMLRSLKPGHRVRDLTHCTLGLLREPPARDRYWLRASFAPGKVSRDMQVSTMLAPKRL